DEDSSTSELTENEEERTQKKTIDNIPIHVENDEGEQNISFVRPSQPVMSLTVTGDEKDINGLNVDDFKLSIDVEGLDKGEHRDRKSTRLNSSHVSLSYNVFCLNIIISILY